MQLVSLYASKAHSAFTDLIYALDTWWCVFREGSTHMSMDGRIRVMVSGDAQQWRTQSVIDWSGADLRDPKLLLRSDGCLLLTAGARWCTPMSSRDYLFSLGLVWDARSQQWQEPVVDAMGKSTWRWAPTWHQTQAYVVGYAGRDQRGALYASQDGLHWRLHLAPFFPQSSANSNETSLAFDPNTHEAIAIVRRDAMQGAVALLGRARPPYVHWHWRRLSYAMGGPKVLRLSNGEWVIASRAIHERKGRARVVLHKLSIRNARLTLWKVLPSDGDCSYAGMVEREHKLYISYYSSHQQHTSIYLAIIPLQSKRRSRQFR